MANDFTEGLGIDANNINTDYQFEDTVDGIVLGWLHNLKKNTIPDNLEKKGVIGGGGNPSKLAGDAAIIITTVKEGMSWTLSMNDYWKYVEKGRGKTVSGGDGAVRRAMPNWITSKGISPADVLQKMNPKSKRLPFDKAMKTLSYIFARSIHKKGYSDWRKEKYGDRGAHFVKASLIEQLPILKETLETKLGRAIQIRIVTDLKGLK